MQPNGADPNGSPIEYPTVTVDGQAFPVKFSNRALYRLDKDGIDLHQFGEKLKTGRISVSMVYDLLAAAMVTPPFMSRPHGEDLAEKVLLADATRAILDAMGKAAPPAGLKLQEPAAKPDQLQ